MATPTYTLIDSTVLGTTAASVTFSSIPATYRDLVLVIQTIASGGSARVRFNSDSGSNYNYVTMSGDGSTATSAAGNASFIYFGVSNGTLSTMQIMDYSATDKHKTALVRLNLASSFVQADAERWADTSAINAIEIYTSSGTFSSGSTFYLYGIAG